jgi:hypothetical protein
MPNWAVQAPDGKVIQFPDNFTESDVNREMSKLYPTDPLVTGAGMGAGQTIDPTISRLGYQMHGTLTGPPSQQEEDILRSGFGAQKKFMQEGYGRALPAAAAAAAPELLPEMGPLATWLAGTGVTAAGAGLGTAGGQVIQGQNPLTPGNLKQSGTSAALAGGTNLAFGALPFLRSAKLGRSMVNESVGATGRDVMYGNPAVALEDEGITKPNTGDLEKMKGALRSGATPQQADSAAGGRFGATSDRINQLGPQLEQKLAASRNMIDVSSAIDKPLQDAASEIINNPAMTQPEKLAAINQLGDLQSEIHSSFGGRNQISPLEANYLKQSIGNRVNWTSTTPVADEVKPAYRSLYGSIKKAVNSAVPEAAPLNERLENLYAANKATERLMGSEEVSRGSGPMRGTIGTNLLGRVESSIGRFLPFLATTSRATQPVASGTAATLPWRRK